MKSDKELMYDNMQRGITLNLRNKKTDQTFLLVICSQCKKQISGVYSYSEDLGLNYCSQCNPNRKKFTIKLVMKEAVILRTTNRSYNQDPEKEVEFKSGYTKKELKELKNMTPDEYDKYLEAKGRNTKHNQQTT